MSQAKKGGLGRGLAALIPTGPANAQGLNTQGLGSAAANVVIGLDPIGPQPASAFLHRVPEPAEETELAEGGAVYREIPPDRIEPNPKQPRQVFDEEALAELVHSIREFGLMQPIVVRRLDGDEERYQLIMGERRWRACQEAGVETIPAIVRETADESMLRDALLENIHRVQLNPLEEAAAYQQLAEEFGVTHEELVTRIGRSRPVVTNMIRLLKLLIPVQRRVAAGVLSAGHARALLGLEAGADAQEALAARIVAEGNVGARHRGSGHAGEPRSRCGRSPGPSAQADPDAGPAGCGRATVEFVRHPRHGESGQDARERSWWSSDRSKIFKRIVSMMEQQVGS